jgi:hypothetical protein
MLAAVAYLEVWRQEIGSADTGVIAAGIVERLRRRLEVLVRAMLALRRQSRVDQVAAAIEAAGERNRISPFQQQANRTCSDQPALVHSAAARRGKRRGKARRGARNRPIAEGR